MNQSNLGIVDQGSGRPRYNSFHFAAAIIFFAAAVVCFAAVLYPFHWAMAAKSGRPEPSDMGTLILGAASKRQRVVSFPKDYSLGKIVINTYPQTKVSQTLQGAAKGTIVVPAGKMVQFIPTRRFYKNPSIVTTLPPDGLDSIVLAASSMDDAEDGLCDRALSYVGHLKGLLEMNLDRSDATDKGAVHAAELPNLQRISAVAALLQGNCFKQFALLKQLRILNLGRNCLKDENLLYLGVSK